MLPKADGAFLREATMNEFTDPPALVRPAISNLERAGQLIEEAREIDGLMTANIRATADQMVRRGQALITAQKLCLKGEFDALLAKKWPEISRSTAYRNMKLATEKAHSVTVTLFTSHTHKVLDDKPGEEDSDEIGSQPLTVAERKILYLLIKTVKPGLGKQLIEGSKILTDSQLLDKVPPSCDKCRRLGPPAKPCETCAVLRSESKRGLFDKDAEPGNPDDPASAPKPPPDPYAQAKKLLTDLASVMTKLIAEDAGLYEALNACGVLEHLSGQTPKFRAVLGVKSVIENVEKGETLASIKRDFDIKSGRLILPMYEKKHRGER